MKTVLGVIVSFSLTSFVVSANQTLQTVTLGTKQVESVHTSSSVKKLRAEDYGLTEADLTKYYQIMEGPYGRWYQDLDPTWVLGFAAETDEERNYYAEIVADMEYARAEKELAFQRAYDGVWKKRGGTYPIIDDARWDGLKQIQEMIKTASKETKKGAATERLALYVRHDCACDVSMQLQQAKGKAVGIDIYVAGARNDDEIRTWAMDQNIPRERVQDREITLNHDEGLFDSFVGSDESMVLFTRTSEGFERRESE